ncbi:MAG TPA: cytochrome c oxidase subunit II [Thermoanaerobaculia bacterium]|nr:cytochrome c oxidase subunit II [Thermoanaerobaculia bacterium]
MKEFLDKYMPPNYSAHGGELDAINLYVHWLMLVLFVVWGALFAFMLWRFRASRNPRANYHGTKSHLSTYGEVGIAIVEVVLLVGFSIPAWYRWTQRPLPETNPLEVRVVAEQFAWNVHYPGPDNVFGKSNILLVSSSNPLGLDPDDPDGKDDIVSINHLHLEVDRAVIVRISSKDVIHSFALQEMRVKQDAIPGMEVPIHFTPTRTSEQDRPWEITCAQLCGLGHYRMRGMYSVHSKEDFAAWMRQNTPAGDSPTPAAGS